MGEYDGGLASLRELLAGLARPIPEATFDEIDVLTAQAPVAYAQVRWADTPEGPMHSVDLLTRDRHLSISAGQTGLLGADLWPLTGAHATTRCESCHKATPEDRKSGHGASYRGAPRECKGCHLDVHAGQFTSKEPVRACDSCHSTTAFKLPSFDHGKATRYALDGAHAAVPCAKCHAKTTLKDGSAAVRYRLPSTECRFCHASPHVRRSP